MILAVSLLACASLAAHARLALLIGNQSYAAKVGPLVNPRADIETVGAALEKLGFTVTKLSDAGKERMDTAICRYVDQVRRDVRLTLSCAAKRQDSQLSKDARRPARLEVSLNRLTGW
ncbi:MAG: caspase family protein, partial [Rhodomicrobium sp.]